MTESTKLLLSGIGLVAIFGQNLFKVIRTDASWPLRYVRDEDGGRMQIVGLPRKEFPKTYWFNIGIFTLFIAMGLWALWMWMAGEV